MCAQLSAPRPSLEPGLGSRAAQVDTELPGNALQLCHRLVGERTEPLSPFCKILCTQVYPHHNCGENARSTELSNQGQPQNLKLFKQD